MHEGASDLTTIFIGHLAERRCRDERRRFASDVVREVAASAEQDRKGASCGSVGGERDRADVILRGPNPCPSGVEQDVSRMAGGVRSA